MRSAGAAGATGTRGQPAGRGALPRAPLPAASEGPAATARGRPENSRLAPPPKPLVVRFRFTCGNLHPSSPPRSVSFCTSLREGCSSYNLGCALYTLPLDCL